MTIPLNVRLTNRAISRSGEDIEGGQYTFDCDLGDLPGHARKQIADRLHDDTNLCKGDVTDAGTVEPSVTYQFNAEEPDLLVVDGTGIDDLIKAVRQDQAEIQDILAYRAARNQKPTA
jgi:hypothetical protein